MRKLLVIFLLIIPCFLFSLNLPLDKELGQIALAENGTAEGRVKEAFSKGFSLSWVEEYVPTELSATFVAFYSEELYALLPLNNLLVGERVGDEIKIRDGDGAVRISVFLDEDLKFTSLGIR